MAGLNKNKNEDSTSSPISSTGNKGKELDFFISENNDDMKKEIKEKETGNNKKSDVFFLSDYPWKDYEE